MSVNPSLYLTQSLIPIFTRYSDYKLNQGVFYSSMNLKLNSIKSRTWNFSNPSNGSKVALLVILGCFGPIILAFDYN